MDRLTLESLPSHMESNLQNYHNPNSTTGNNNTRVAKPKLMETSYADPYELLYGSGSRFRKFCARIQVRI